MKFLKYISLIIGMFWLVNISPTRLEAQCPMCRMAAESNLKEGGTQGRGLNAGILYMLATPYLIVGILGYVWWKNKQKDHANQENN